MTNPNSSGGLHRLIDASGNIALSMLVGSAASSSRVLAGWLRNIFGSAVFGIVLSLITAMFIGFPDALGMFGPAMLLGFVSHIFYLLSR